MHHALKIPVVNLAEQSWNTFGEEVSSSVQQSIVSDIYETVSIHLLIIHYDYLKNINDRIIL